MRVVNNNSFSYQNKSLDKCLQTAEKEKKWNYLEAYLQKRRHFYPFVILIDGLLGMEAEATLNRLSVRLTTKWK